MRGVLDYTLKWSKQLAVICILKILTLLMCVQDFEKESERKNKKSFEMMEKNIDCPLCLEALDIDDKNFYPCTCGYQVCRFCWHRIRTNENGLCPACRRIYSENPANFIPSSQEQVKIQRQQQKLKDIQRKQKLAENRKQLANIRVIQKNLVFGVGFPLELSQDTQKKEKVLQMFRNFGPTHKEAITDRTSYAGSQGPSACVYITYQRPEDAVRAVKTLTNTKMEGRTIKVSLGTTKYCSNFLKNVHCPKADCLYLHEIADEEASFTKEDIHAGKHLVYEQKLIEQTLNCTFQKINSNNQTSRTNINQNADNSSESSEEPQNSSCYDSSEASELSPSSNSQNLEHRSIDSDLNLETENNHQNIHTVTSSVCVEASVGSNSINPVFMTEDNIIINHSQQNSSFLDSSHNVNQDFSSHQLPKENVTVHHSNFLQNQMYESALQNSGQSSSTASESNILKLLSSLSVKNDTNSFSNVLNMKQDHGEPETVKDDPDLEFDPCQESLNALQDLLISEQREKARILHNSLNRSLLNRKSPTLPHHHSPDGFGLRNSFSQSLKTRDPPPGFANSYPQNMYKSSYDVGNSIINKSPIALHNQLGLRANYPLQRFQQPNVPLNGSSFVDFSPQMSRDVHDLIPPLLQQQQHSQRFMNVPQTQFSVSDLTRTSPQWNTASQTQWRPAENAFFNQSINESRASNDFNLRMQQMRSNELRQWQQMNGNANSLSPFSVSDLPQSMTPEQLAKLQALYKSYEAAQRNNSGSLGGHRLQYTKKL